MEMKVQLDGMNKVFQLRNWKTKAGRPMLFARRRMAIGGKIYMFNVTLFELRNQAIKVAGGAYNKVALKTVIGTPDWTPTDIVRCCARQQGVSERQAWRYWKAGLIPTDLAPLAD